MKKHLTAPYLLNPTHPVTVAVIGVGGNGSNMLNALARMHVSLQALGHPGLMVTAYDDDKVSASNIGRQQFSDAEIGLPKSTILISRINRFYAINWKASADKFPVTKTAAKEAMANIIITCVDLIKTRLELHSILYETGMISSEWKIPYYWLDLGNDAKTGQVYLATVQLPKGKASVPLHSLFLRFKSLKKQKDDPNEPSCSVAEALRKQDLYINSTLAQLAAALLWKMFREGSTSIQGAFVNLETFSVTPIKIS